MNQVPSESIAYEDEPAVSDSGEADARISDEVSVHAPRAMPNNPDRQESAYALVARQCMPVWQRIAGFSPWWDIATHARRVAHRPVLELFRQQASIYGLSLGLKLDAARVDAQRLRACIRAGLFHWQEALDPEGRPVSVRRRGSKLWPAVVQQVVRTVDEIGLPHVAELPHDLARHLNWLRKKSYGESCGVEAALIESLACGAIIARDSNLHRAARERLPGLLHRQSTEGWFAEHGGVDVGRLSLTIDSLARLYLDHDWGELFDPLQRAIRFLVPLVHPDGSGGGCYGTCDASFVSPYALERLSRRQPEAAILAERLHNRWARNLNKVPGCWHDNITAVLGSAIAATAVLGSPQPGIAPIVVAPFDPSKESPTHPVPDHPTEKRFREARLTLVYRKSYEAIVAGRRGGACQVRWFATGRIVDYPGIMVLFAHTVRSSRAPGAGYECPAEQGTMSWRGMLLRAGPRAVRWWQRLWKATVGRIWLRPGGSVVTRFKEDTSRGRNRLLHDWFARNLSFGDETITIRDQILTRLPPDAVVLESAIGEQRWADRCGANALRDEPIVIEGARALTITRVYRDAALESCRVERHADFL